MPRTVLLLTITASLLLLAMPAHACSCMIEWTPTALLEASDLVAAGRVTSIEEHTDGWSLIVGFETYAVWKGPVQATYGLVTAPDEAACGVSLTVGEEYLVYGTDDGEGLYTINLCGRNRLLIHAEEDLDELGPPLVVPTPETSFGMIKAGYE